MTGKTKFSIFVSAFLLLVALCTNSFAAYDYGFQHIVEKNDELGALSDGAIGEAQMSFTVLFNDELAEFTFKNNGPAASSITDIYFDDDEPFLLWFDNTAGDNETGFDYSEGAVRFDVGAKPSDLPAGDIISFSSDYDYDSDVPTQPNGVNPGEWVKLYFKIATGYTFGDLIAALNDESFRVGIKVQGFASGGSETFVNGPPHDVVPEPATMLLFGLGLVGMAGMGRKKK